MKTNLLTTIRTAAETAGYKFAFGKGRSFEFALSQMDTSAGAIGLMLNVINASQTMQSDMWNGELVYNVQFFIFRKSEQVTFSSLSETTTEKWDNRMDELQTELLKFISTLTQCNNEIDLINPTHTPTENQNSINIDGWLLECQLRLHNQYPS